MRLLNFARISIGFLPVQLSGSLLHAQTTGAGIVMVAARHHLLGDPLIGAAVMTHSRERAGSSFHVGVETLWGSAERVGSPCSGLIEPGRCAPEPLRDAARLTQLTAGLGQKLGGSPRWAVGYKADLGIARVSVATRPITPGNGLQTSKLLGAGFFGAEVTWLPAARSAALLALQLDTGLYLPLVRENVADGYTPLESGFSASSIRLGLLWRSDR